MEENKTIPMKKLLLLFLILSFANAFSQEYHFDQIIKSKSSRIKPDKNEWISYSFYDSVTKSKMFLNTKNEKTIATIYQSDRNLRHVFDVIKTGGKLNFIYKFSNQFTENNKDTNKENIIKVEKIDSYNYKITAFNNSRLKRKKIALIVTVEKSEFDYVEINADYTRTDEMEEQLKQLLDPEMKYIVKRVQIQYSSGYIFDNSLVDVKKTDLDIKIPEKIILKEYNYWSDFD